MTKKNNKKEEYFKMTLGSWFVIAIVIFALAILFLTGGLNQSYWPGKPYYLK